MGISTAFLNELSTQRAAAEHDLRLARADGDEGAAGVALARLADLDELLSRNGGADVRLDLTTAEGLTPAC